MEELVENPEFSRAQEIIEEYVSRAYTLQLNGLCSVNYQGRAKSKLDRGERIVVKKQDSALLVHGPENYQPRNWQPEVDTWDVELDDEADELVLTARRTSPEELVEIRFESIDFISVSKMVDKSELKIRGHEVDIHESIEEDPEIVEENLKVIERERETPAGFIDVFARDSSDEYVVIEVKRNPDYNTVLQLQRYVDEIEDEFSGGVRGILVAPKMTEKVLDYLEDRDLEFVEVEMEDVIASYETIDRGQKEIGDFSADYTAE
ncbi:MAG: endonuclease NucS [Candidatus Nanohaloarchaea archaeon]